MSRTKPVFSRGAATAKLRYLATAATPSSFETCSAPGYHGLFCNLSSGPSGAPASGWLPKNILPFSKPTTAPGPVPCRANSPLLFCPSLAVGWLPPLSLDKTLNGRDGTVRTDEGTVCCIWAPLPNQALFARQPRQQLLGEAQPPVLATECRPHLHILATSSAWTASTSLSSDPDPDPTATAPAAPAPSALAGPAARPAQTCLRNFLAASRASNCMRVVSWSAILPPRPNFRGRQAHGWVACIPSRQSLRESCP